MSSWIQSKKFDLTFVLLPGILSVLFVIISNELNFIPSNVSPLVWLVLVVFVDVGHVWSTLFRTYFHKYSSQEFSKQLFLIPVISWGAGVVLYTLSSKIFWSMLAYAAVFHFIRQQVGILKIYLRHTKKDFWNFHFDIFLCYLVTIIPIIYWHITPRSFNWFIEDDFVMINFARNIKVLWGGLCFFILVYLIKEILNYKEFNFAKNLHLISTALVWFFGIVYYNNDWTFTFTNIIHHGIPYFALVWASSMRGAYTAKNNLLQKIMNKGLKIRFIFFISLLLILGFCEEFVWDTFVWHEHNDLFFNFLSIDVDHLTLAWLVPLLSLPQITHYILDGFIWKRHRKINEFKF